MLEHLIHAPAITDTANFTPLHTAAPDKIVSAKVATTKWLEDLGVVSDAAIEQEIEVDRARKAFGSLVATTDTDDQRTALAAIKTPVAVQHLTGMLTAYDWEFVQQAKELRGYTVAKIIEETKHTNPSVRLKALGMLGRVTEVGLFTEKIEIKKADLTDSELETRIKEKLNRFMQVVDVVDVSDVPEQLHDSQQS
jgi:hypothetical protein